MVNIAKRDISRFLDQSGIKGFDNVSIKWIQESQITFYQMEELRQFIKAVTVTDPAWVENGNKQLQLTIWSEVTDNSRVYYCDLDKGIITRNDKIVYEMQF
jgi:hypothetical protein